MTLWLPWIFFFYFYLWWRAHFPLKHFGTRIHRLCIYVNNHNNLCNTHRPLKRARICDFVKSNTNLTTDDCIYIYTQSWTIGRCSLDSETMCVLSAHARKTHCWFIVRKDPQKCIVHPNPRTHRRLCTHIDVCTYTTTDTIAQYTKTRYGFRT